MHMKLENISNLPHTDCLARIWQKSGMKHRNVCVSCFYFALTKKKSRYHFGKTGNSHFFLIRGLNNSLPISCTVSVFLYITTYSSVSIAMPLLLFQFYGRIDEKLTHFSILRQRRQRQWPFYRSRNSQLAVKYITHILRDWYKSVHFQSAFVYLIRLCVLYCVLSACVCVSGTQKLCLEL